jgi:hypothetical protein
VKSCSNSLLCWVDVRQDFAAPIFAINQSLCVNCQKVCWQRIICISNLLTQASKPCLNNCLTLVNSPESGSLVGRHSRSNGLDLLCQLNSSLVTEFSIAHNFFLDLTVKMLFSKFEASCQIYC